MKHLLLFVLCAVSTAAMAQGVGINSTGAPAHPSAGLDVDFTDRGLLIPRLTTAQRDAISNPADGLMIYNTDNECTEFYSTSGGWFNVCSLVKCAGFSASISVTGNVSCNGGSDGSVEVTPLAGTSPYSYLWNSGDTTAIVSGLSAGTYSVTVTDANGCSISDAAVVTQPTAITATATSNSPVTVSQIELYASATGGTLPYSGYSWSGPNGFSSSQQNPIKTNLTSADFGIYTVTVTDLLGCTGVDTTLVTYNFLCGVSTISDGQGNTYGTVKIGTQCWMSENLNTTHNVGASYCYGNVTANCDSFGRLYEWAAIMDGEPSSTSNPSGVQGLCPNGWHVPSNEEWCEMEAAIGLNVPCSTTGLVGTDEGTQIKATSPTWNGTDDHGFTALPSGYASTGANFTQIGAYALFWTATEVSSTNALMHYVYTAEARINRHAGLDKQYAMSVRCVQD